MPKCFNCGAEFTGNFCPDCGLPADNSLPTPAPIPEPAPNPGPQPYAPPPVYNNITVANNNTTSTGGWFGWQLLEALLPIIGIILMLCVSNDDSVKNYAKARLIWCAVAIVLVFIIIIPFFAVINSSL